MRKESRFDPSSPIFLLLLLLLLLFLLLSLSFNSHKSTVIQKLTSNAHLVKSRSCLLWTERSTAYSIASREKKWYAHNLDNMRWLVSQEITNFWSNLKTVRRDFSISLIRLDKTIAKLLHEKDLWRKLCGGLNDILRHCICWLVKLDIFCFKRIEFNEAKKIVLLSKLQGNISFFSPTFLKNVLDQ